MEKQNNFKPYIPAEKITPELTITSIVMGVILAVVFGAANAYLGLRVGMTVSASIPNLCNEEGFPQLTSRALFIYSIAFLQGLVVALLSR